MEQTVMYRRLEISKDYKGSYINAKQPKTTIGVENSIVIQVLIKT